jgi:hypothetical protein
MTRRTLSLWWVLLRVAGAALLLAACSREDAPGAPTDRPPYRATTISTGTSMLPTFAEVEVVQLELCDFGDLRTGDTVIFWHDRLRLYAHHRLVRRDPVTNRWITQGDNNAFPDRGAMTADEFVGRTHKL